MTELRDTGASGRRAAAGRIVTGALLAGAVAILAACTSGGGAVESASTAVTGSPSAPVPTGGSASSTTSSGPSTATATSSGGTPTRTSGSASGSATATSGTAPAGGDATGAAYCESKGGRTQTRDATFGTNNDQTAWLPLAGTTQVCRFQADDDARSRIYVDFATLTSTRPTLAGLAYLSRPPVPPSSGGANPATGYCTALGGSSTFGEVGVSGGGWVNKDDPDDVVVSLCVFPDQSFIDEWGLTYHAGGIVRGQDLAAVMAYQPPDPLPGVFPVGTPTASPTAGTTAESDLPTVAATTGPTASTPGS